MLTLYIGNKNYSSWSLRGWLACKQSGLPFAEHLFPLWTPEHDDLRRSGRLPAGKVPTLWDGDVCVWDSLAIVDWLADRVGRDVFWPADEAARAFARSISAEMHSGFAALRNQAGMNIRRRVPNHMLDSDAVADAARADALWSEARTRFGAGGAFLFGKFGAADIMFAPVVTRFVTYGIPMSDVSRAYADAIYAQPFMAEWLAASTVEPWVIEKYEV